MEGFNVQRERNRNRKYRRRRRCRNIAAIARMADTKDSKMQRTGYTENQVIGYDRNVISLTRYATYTLAHTRTQFTHGNFRSMQIIISSMPTRLNEVHTYVRNSEFWASILGIEHEIPHWFVFNEKHRDIRNAWRCRTHWGEINVAVANHTTN